MSCTLRIATLEHAVQNELSIPGTFSRNVAADVTSHRSIPTSTRAKAISTKACNTEGMARTKPCTQTVSVSVCLSVFDSELFCPERYKKREAVNSTCKAGEVAQKAVPAVLREEQGLEGEERNQRRAVLC